MISELAVNKWARRVDIVTVNGEIVAYEIKTSVDRLSRLAGQISTYSEVCDRVYGVMASKHMNVALSSLPDYVGIKEIVAFRGRLEVRHVRDASLSPSVSRQSSLALLPAKELAKLVRSELGCRPGARRADIERQVALLSHDAVRGHIREYLRAKHRETTAALKKGTSGRRITANDLFDLRVLARGGAPDVGVSQRLNPNFLEWVNMLAEVEAFGSVPEDVRALLQSSFQGSSVSNTLPGAL